MAAVNPLTEAAPRGRAPPRARANGTSLSARIGAAALALACGSAGIVIAHAYPVAPLVVVALFAACTTLAFFRFSLALPAALALLPVLGFAPVTGWLVFEETDLLILACCAGGYAAFALRPATIPTAERRHGPTLSIFSIALMALFLGSAAIALERGIAGAGAFRFDWAAGYDDPLNSLRIFKSFAWVMLASPLLLGELRRPGGLDRIGLGLTVALGFETLAVLQERLAFTGLLDFTDDYRVTGSFWEMHVGGAALDGFLALTIPFAVREALRDSARAAVRPLDHARVAGAWIVLALAAYASFVTFSRGVYAAVPLSVVLLVALVIRRRARPDRSGSWALLGKVAIFVSLVAASGYLVFRGGGYRAVLAAFLVLAVAIPVESSIRRIGPGAWAAAAMAAAVLGGAGWAAGTALPKGPYVVFALALAAAVAMAARTARRPTRRDDLLIVAAWLWLALSACLVSRHWGGPGAFADAAAVLGTLVALAFAASRLPSPVWPQKRNEQLATVGLAALVMGAVAVFTAGAYMGNRFASTRGDLDVRIAHWTEGIGRLHGVGDWLFGKGLGRFPATSQFESPDAIAPGSYRIARRGGESFLALTGPRVRYLGFGELFRVSQRVRVEPRTTYLVTLVARSAQQTPIHVELCEKQLLYGGACVIGEPQVGGEAGGWQSVTVPLQTGAIGGSHWLLPRPVVFAIANGNPGAVLEIRSIRMIGPDGTDGIANGAFADGTTRWFSSSDKWHLPWHIKNIVLDVLFDQGAFGLALFALLVGGALLRTTVGRAFRHPDAPFVAAAIAGYLVVGAFDSLVDVPRVAFAFYLVTVIGLMLRNPRVESQASSRGSRTSVAPVIAASADEATARAARRRKSFGERRPATG